MTYQELKQIISAGRKFNKDLKINGFMFLGDKACLMNNNDIVATIPRAEWEQLLGPYDYNREYEAIQEAEQKMVKRYNSRIE